MSSIFRKDAELGNFGSACQKPRGKLMLNMIQESEKNTYDSGTIYWVASGSVLSDPTVGERNPSPPGMY